MKYDEAQSILNVKIVKRIELGSAFSKIYFTDETEIIIEAGDSSSLKYEIL
jgi:hypothetical protein